MNRLVAIFVCALLAFGCGEKRKPTTATEYAGRTVDVNDSLLRAGGGIADTIDLGRMRSGEVVESSLMFRNTGDRPFVILSVESSCGCTTVDYPKAPIESQATKSVTFTFDSKGFNGWQFKLLKFRTTLDAQPISIFITADVE